MNFLNSSMTKTEPDTANMIAQSVAVNTVVDIKSPTSKVVNGMLCSAS